VADHLLDDEAKANAVASDAGVTASFPASDLTFHVAPTLTTRVNTLRPALRPSACWRMDDSRFHFDSSFILPEASKEFALLRAVRSPTAGATGLLLSVFGHADPTGADDYNKTLSGRRATAVYALLVRDTTLWEELYSNPFHGDTWSIVHIQIMLRALGKTGATTSGFLDASTTAAVKEFQGEVRLKQSGFPGTDTRKALFVRYMDVICQDDSGPFSYQLTDFLGLGSSANGKADRQGCSEFNPILVFSKADAKEFEKPGNKATRDAANLPNRRVVIYMFDPALGIDVAKWPCPTVKEGVAGCKAQFFADADARRTPQELQRQYLQRGRTIACKFYDRLARQSPCETVRKNLVIVLLGNDGLPSKNAPYRLKTGAQIRTNTTNGAGQVVEPQVFVGLTCEIEWGLENAQPTDPVFPHYAEIFLNASEGDAVTDLANLQLANLGFRLGDDELNRRAFRLEYDDTDSSDSTINEAHRTGRPKKRRLPTV